MSFPGFKYLEIVKQNWEDSNFYEKVEKKFLFVVFQYDEAGRLWFKKVLFWNMPFEAREEARRVWEDTKNRVILDASDLPRATESWVAHVRPKGRDNEDVLLTPQGNSLPKKCFWLNKKYIAEIVS